MTINKRYIAFAGENYYPCGGWNDMRLETNDLGAAQAAIKGTDWGHVVDMETGAVIYER